MSRSERATQAALARSARLTPERRQEISRIAHLAGAVKAVVSRRADATPEQVAAIRREYCECTT